MSTEEIESSDIGDAVSVLASDATSSIAPGEHDVEEEEFEKRTSSDVVEPNTFNIRPLLEDRFKVSTVKDVIHNVLNDELSGKTYSQQDAKIWSTHIANIINSKVRDMKWKRYKHIVQVIIGEQRGAGVKSGLKCVWDSETDNFAHDIFMNESIFCLVAVFAIYFY